jgi:hypothetical protein
VRHTTQRQLQQLASEADRFQITDVTSLLEEAVMGQLCLEAGGVSVRGVCSDGGFYATGG